MTDRAEDQKFLRYRDCGDAEALAEVFDRTAPKLLLLAVHMVRDADLAEDLVQATFLAAIESAAQYRPGTPLLRWLTRILSNRAKAERRAARRRQDARASLGTPPPTSGSPPDPLKLTTDQEALEQVVQAIDGLPEPYHAVLVLRLVHGLQPTEIAHSLGRAPGTVRTQLQRGLQILRQALPKSLMVPAALLATSQVSLAAVRQVVLAKATATTTAGATVALTGGAVMIGKWILATGAAMVAVAALLLFWPDKTPSTSEGSRGQTQSPAAAAQTGHTATEVTDPSQPRREEVRLPSVERATTGDLLVCVRYADEPRPAAEVPVTLHRAGGDFRVDILRGRTDASGAARFDAVPVGNWVANTGLALNPRRLKVVCGELTEVVLNLNRGMTLTGVVVDDAGDPVASALIEVGKPHSAADPMVMTATRADGTFELRACPRYCLVGARAAGYASSAMQYVRGNEKARQHVRIELVAPGGVVEGFVVCRDGEPVVDAVVRVGQGPTDHLMALEGSQPSLPAQVRTDKSGRFRAIGVPVGEQPVQVRAVGFEPWRGSCVVAANIAVPLRIALAEGARCEGAVISEDGAPVAGASIRVGAKGDFLQLFASTNTEGRFTMEGLPVGEVELTATHDVHGKATAGVHVVAGRSVRCRLRFRRAHDLRGRVIGEAGQPVADLWVRVAVEDGGEQRMKNARTDRDGRFVVPSLPGGTRVTVTITGSLIDTVRRSDIDPAAGEALLRVRIAPCTAAIRGVVLGIDGKPAPGIDVAAVWQHASDYRTAKTGVDGSFEVGPLRAGRWQLQVAKDGCARYRSPMLTLNEHQKVDLSAIRLYRGGTFLARVVGAPAKRTGLLIYNDKGDLVQGVLSTVVPLRSPPLHPGGYALRVHGQGLAAMSLPFTIRDGQETELAVVVKPGTRQRFEFRFSSGQAPDWFVFDVRRGDSVLLSGAASATDKFVVDRWFAPGDYEVLVSDDSLKGGANFTVGRKPGPPLIVYLH